MATYIIIVDKMPNWWGWLVTSIRCKVCSKVEGKEKLLVPKLNYSLKHARRRKVIATILGVKWEFYENKKCQHAKKWSYICLIPFHSILQLVINANLAFNKKKFVQFVVILYLLAHGKLMIDFENMNYFMNSLNVKHYTKKH